MIGLKLETPLEKCTHAVGARAALWLQKSHVLHAPGTSCGKNGALEELCGARALILNIQCHAKAGEMENRVREAHVLEIVPVIRQTEM